MSSKRAVVRYTSDHPAPPPVRGNIIFADRESGTHLLQEPHESGERWIEIDSQEVWNLGDLV